MKLSWQMSIAVLFLTNLYTAVLGVSTTWLTTKPIRTIQLLTTTYRPDTRTLSRTQYSSTSASIPTSSSKLPTSAAGLSRTTGAVIGTATRTHLTDRHSGSVPGVTNISNAPTNNRATSTTHLSTLSSTRKPTTSNSSFSNSSPPKVTTESSSYPTTKLTTRLTTNFTTKLTTNLTTKLTTDRPTSIDRTPKVTKMSTTTTVTPTSTDGCPAGTHRVWFWITDYVPVSTIPGLSQLTNSDTAGQCRAACTAGSLNNSCVSFAFRPAERKCVLYSFRFFDPGVTSTAAKTNFFFEGRCQNYSLPRCPSSQQMPVLRYIKDRYYEPGAEDGEEVLAETLDQCLSACARTWNSQRRCQSVNYGKQTGSVCKLIYKSRGGDELSTSVHYDFYEYTCFKDPGICSSRTQANRVWYAFTNRSYTVDPDADDIISDVSSYVGCQNLCFYHRKRSCKTVVYRTDTKQCLMYKDRYDQRVQIGHDLYQYSCPEKNIKQCSSNMELIWARFQGRTLADHHDKVIDGVDTAKRCQNICLNMSSWVCKSVIYDEATKVCILSGVNRDDLAVPVVTSRDKQEHVSYYEWFCKLGSCFEKTEKVYFEFRNKLLRYRDDVIYSDVTTFQECLTKCSELTSFTCRSLEYSDKTLTCRLSELTAADAEEGELIDSNDEQYRYVEWRCRNYKANFCYGQPGSTLYWSEVPRSRLQGGYIKKLGNIHSQSQCEEVCVNASQCQSIEYKETASECEINNVNTDIKDIVPYTDEYKYLEWRCAKPEYKPCVSDEENYWEAFVGRRYRNPSKLTITKSFVLTLIACQQLCLKAKQEADINCESIEYHHQNKTCYLFSGTARRDQLVPGDVNIVYLERHCRKVQFNRCTPGTRFLPNITVEGHALRTDPHAAVYAAYSLQQCQSLCQNHTVFQCESIDYSLVKQKCVLHAVNQVDGLQTVASSSYNHYEMACVVPVLPATAGAGKIVYNSSLLTLMVSLWCLYVLPS